MPSRNLLVLLSLGLILLLPGAFAGQPSQTAPDERYLVSAINLQKGTIDITHQGHHIVTTYVFAPDVVIVINKKPAQTKDIRVGLQRFSFKLGPGMEEPAVLEELDLITAQPVPGAKKK